MPSNLSRSTTDSLRENLLAFHDSKVSKPIPSTGRGFVLLGTEHHFLSPNNKPARARQHGDKVLNFRDYIYQFEPEAPYTEVSKKLVRCALTWTVYSPSQMRAICQAKRTLFLPVEGILPFPKEHLTKVRYLTVDIYPSIYSSTRKMAAFLMLLSKPDIRLKDLSIWIRMCSTMDKGMQEHWPDCPPPTTGVILMGQRSPCARLVPLQEL